MPPSTGTVALLVFLVVGAITAVLGPVGVFLGPLVVLLGVVTGVVPFGYGYWFGRHDPPTDPGTATDAL